MECYKCKKITEVYKKDRTICGQCRELAKVDMSRYIRLKLEHIYLHENNRNKTGRKPRLTATEQSDIFYAYKNGESMGKLAKKYKVSRSTIFNIVH